MESKEYESMNRREGRKWNGTKYKSMNRRKEGESKREGRK